MHYLYDWLQSIPVKIYPAVVLLEMRSKKGLPFLPDTIVAMVVPDHLAALKNTRFAIQELLMMVAAELEKPFSAV